MAFISRLLSVTFALGEGSFGSDGANNVTLDGLRISAHVQKAGGPSMGTLSMEVYGMTFSKMNKLSTLGMAPQLVRRNTVTLQAGDATNGLGTVFQGTITNAWADFQGQPDVAFHVEAHTGLIEAVKPAPVSSYPGPTDVATIMSSLASQMQLDFENNGVNVKLSKPYYYGSARNQAKAVADAANINWIIDNGKLAIWNKGQSRGGTVPLVSPTSGLVGYPAYTSKGIALRSIFNPSIGFGSKIQVQSSLDPANGEWVVYSLEYELQSNLPSGQWFSNIQATRPGNVVLPQK